MEEPSGWKSLEGAGSNPARRSQMIIIARASGQTTHGYLTYAAGYRPETKEGVILRFMDDPFTLDHWHEHQLAFEGSILELGCIADRRHDPSTAGRVILPGDYDYAILTDLYNQVVEHLNRRLSRPFEVSA